MRFTSTRTTVARGFAVALVVGAALLVTSCGGNPAPAVAPSLSGPLAAAGPLLGSIGTAVPGLSQAQSILGAGSLLGLAKARMPADQFSQVGGAIPGTDALIGEAVKMGLPSQLGGMSDVVGFLGKSGISSNQLTQMAPVLAKAMGSKVSPTISNAFLTALK